ncbi:MAG: hypothetical protein HY958_00935 [Bacteroidia bacterium]|nr:hypothetical protein [Bacteroidia bacterium]
MKKYFPVIIAALLIFSSCSTHNLNSNRDKKYGGAFRINMPSVPKSLYPPGINEIVSSQIISMVHAGLVKFNSRNLVIMPCIAKKWKTDSTNTVFTFYLRNNAFFHDDACFPGGKGRKITAADFQYSLELLCTQDSFNYNFFPVSGITGAKKYYEESRSGKPKTTIEGIKIINDSMLQITLEKSNPYFLNFLANPSCSVLPHEAVDKYGKNTYVGAGPFVMKEKLIADNPFVLTRSEKFFLSDDKGLQQPYLDSIKISFNGSSQKELNLFFKGDIDLIININRAQVPDIMENHIKEFEAKPPKYIMGSVVEENVQLYNLMYPYVKDFYTNSMNYIDLSLVYFDKTVNPEKQNNVNQ